MLPWLLCALLGVLVLALLGKVRTLTRSMEEICDQMEDKENGTYLFLSKHQDGSVFEYQVEIMDEQFNLSYIEIRTGGAVYRADFDSAN